MKHLSILLLTFSILSQAEDVKTTEKPLATSVIQIWLWGGPSHLDTFDPKPKAGKDYCGPLGKPIDTNVPGIQISQLLPKLATMADKYALLRGMTHGINGHETAAYMLQTGHKPGGSLVYPGLGAVVSYFKGYRGGYKGLLPPYITLTRTQGRFSECGFLGSSYKPFATGGDPGRNPFLVEGVVVEGITPARQASRRTLLSEIDGMASQTSEQPLLAGMLSNQNTAYEMILGDASKVFTLTEEPEATRIQYGQTTFGQSCLLARRLVERGVPFITINSGGWDTHKRHFEAMNRKLPDLDTGVSALIQDLAKRGLLDRTIIWVSGEFGRTPKVDNDPPWEGGRGHYGKAFSALIAGGGLKGGVVVGQTDAKGENVLERPITPADLIGTMYDRLGIERNAMLPTPQGTLVSAHPLADPPEEGVNVKRSLGVLKELMP